MEQAYNILSLVLEVVLLIMRMWFEVAVSVYKKIVPPTPEPVNGEIVLITGTGHGIGRELALQYAALGATVVGWDLNQQTNEDTIKQIAKNGGPKAYAYQ